MACFIVSILKLFEIWIENVVKEYITTKTSYYDQEAIFIYVFHLMLQIVHIKVHPSYDITLGR